MKHNRLFSSQADLNAAIQSSTVSFLGVAIQGNTTYIGRKTSVTPPGPDYSEPFYIDVRGAVDLEATSGLQMSTDKTNWTDTTATTLSSGKTYFRVASDQSEPLWPDWSENKNSDYDIGGNINSLVTVDFENDTNCYMFQAFFSGKTKLKRASDLILPTTTLANNCYVNMFEGCTSLTTAPVLPATTLAEACYSGMFSECTSLTTAPVLPATTLAISCYNSMFAGCTSLTTAPVLPATTLAEECYYNMFAGCTSLTTAPVLPATTLAEACYITMFASCSSLTTAPVLPATTLANQCYYFMFANCTSLTTAPVLPATTLVQSCYSGMFHNCSALTTAPVLPATTLAISCYNDMFAGCTNLNYIKCLATDISATNCTRNWVNGVAATGTFVKDSSMSSWSTGRDGIPSGWTVQDATN